MTHSKLSLSLLLALTLASASAMAQTNKTIEAANSQLSFSVTSQAVTYHELDVSHVTGGAYLDSETGTLPGYTVQWKGQGDLFELRDMVVQASLHGATGSLGYDGFLQDMAGNIVSPYQSTSSANLTDYSLRVGKAIPTSVASQVVPFIGYQSHQWVRTMAPPYGYQETYNHNALEVGIMGQAAFTPKLVGTATLSFGSMQDAKMQVSGASTYTLRDQDTKSLELSVYYALDKNWHLSATVGRTEFEYGQSAVVSNSYEPDSRTSYDYVALGVGYHF